MRKIVLSMVMSLDGFVAGEDGDSSWHVMDEEMHDFMDDFLDSVDTLLYGRVAYEMMLQHWPSAEFDKKSTEKNRSFARKMNKMKKLFSLERWKRQNGMQDWLKEMWLLKWKN